jgi:hypothetical protein
MIKLAKYLFTQRPIADAVPPRRCEEHIPDLRRERLISVWTRDPATGRLVCSWKRPAREEASETANAEEPPQSFRIAA